jgi:hypothetical protein
MKTPREYDCDACPVSEDVGQTPRLVEQTESHGDMRKPGEVIPISEVRP